MMTRIRSVSAPPSVPIPPHESVNAAPTNRPLTNKSGHDNLHQGKAAISEFPSSSTPPQSSPRPASPTLAKLQRRVAQQELRNRFSSQGTILDLLALSNERGVSPGASVIGVEETMANGEKRTVLHSDELLSESLHATEMEEMADKIMSGELSEKEKRQILTNILESREKGLDSDTTRHIKKMIDGLSNAPERLADDMAFLSLLHEAKVAMRLEDIIEKYQPEEGSAARAIIKQALNDLHSKPELFHEDEHFNALLDDIRDDIWDRGSKPAVAELQRLLKNTLQTYHPLPGSVAHDRITQTIDHLQREPDALLSIADLQCLVRDIGEDLHKSMHALNPHLSVRAIIPRSVPLMPTESMKQWMAAVEATGKTSDPEQQRCCSLMLEEAKIRWLQHQLTFSDMRSYFPSVAEHAKQNGLVQLGELATSLASKTPDATHDNFDVNKEDLKYKTLLLDNKDYRFFESALADDLIKKPTQGMQESMTKLGRALAKNIMPDDRSLTNEDEAQVVGLWRTMQSNEYAWLRQIPQLDNFMSATNSASAIKELRKFLNAPKTSGLECIAIPCLATNTLNAAPKNKWPAWYVPQSVAYQKMVQPRRVRISDRETVVSEMNARANMLFQSGEINNETANLMQSKAKAFREDAKRNAVKTADGGIGLLHQPSAVKESWMRPVLRTVIDSKPDFSSLQERQNETPLIASTSLASDNKLTKSFQKSLAHGIPFAGDLSGVTQRLLYMVDEANRKGDTIDARDTLITTAMFLNYIGAHSLHECLSVANMFDGKGEDQIDLGLALGDSSKPDDFVSDYNWLFNGKDGEHIKAASEAAFRKTLDQS